MWENNATMIKFPLGKHQIMGSFASVSEPVKKQQSYKHHNNYEWCPLIKKNYIFLLHYLEFFFHANFTPGPERSEGKTSPTNQQTQCPEGPFICLDFIFLFGSWLLRMCLSCCKGLKSMKLLFLCWFKKIRWLTEWVTRSPNVLYIQLKSINRRNSSNW